VRAGSPCLAHIHNALRSARKAAVAMVVGGDAAAAAGRTTSDDEPLVSPPSHGASLVPQLPAQSLSADDEYSPVERAASASMHTSVAVSRLKEHALASVRRADQLRHEMVQRSTVELAQAQRRSARMEEIVDTMVAAQNSYLQHLQRADGGAKDGVEHSVDEVAALAELHDSSERSIAEMHEMFAVDSPTVQLDSSESRWQGDQERLRKDTVNRKRLAAKKAPVPKRAKPTADSGAASEELEKAKALAEQRGKEVARLKKALQQSRAEAARLTTELEATLEADVSKLEQVQRQVGEQRKVQADARLMKQLQTAQAMLEAEQLLHGATQVRSLVTARPVLPPPPPPLLLFTHRAALRIQTRSFLCVLCCGTMQRDAREAQLTATHQIERLRNGRSIADAEGGGGGNAAAIADSSPRDSGGAGSAAVRLSAGSDSGSASDVRQLRSELEMAHGRERRANEQVSSLEVQVNRLELELELARINGDGRADAAAASGASVTQAATAHGSVIARREQSLLESTHLRKAIVRLEAEHAAQEQAHAREMVEAGTHLEAVRAEIVSYQRRLEAASAETASVVASREELRGEIVAEKKRYESVWATVGVQRASIKKMYGEVRGVRLQAFGTECMAELREGAWLTKYADTTFKIKRIFAHIRSGRLYWGKKPGDVSGTSVDLGQVRSVQYGYTAAQHKHLEQNENLAPSRQRQVHPAWHCVTVFMKDGKAVSLAGPMHDDVPVTAAATRGGAASGGFGEGCQDMIAWCAGISAYAAQQQSGGANPFARRDFSGGASGSVVVPSQGSLLWARCRMRVDHKAQQRQT
jgi:hypothetical protein